MYRTSALVFQCIYISKLPFNSASEPGVHVNPLQHQKDKKVMAENAKVKRLTKGSKRSLSHIFFIPKSIEWFIGDFAPWLGAFFYYHRFLCSMTY